jgi:hypothetical protein
MIWKTLKKDKSNSEMIWKIQKKIEKKTGKILKKSKLNSDKIWKIRKKNKSNSENDMENVEEK